MAADEQRYREILSEVGNDRTLVAVSKLKPAEDILQLYNIGHRDFGENYVQETAEKYQTLPKDIRWHFIGHLQSNKARTIAPFVHLIHGVDSLKLLKEINKQAAVNNRIISCLLQVHIAEEISKFGFDADDLTMLFNDHKSELEALKNIMVTGLMGMATFTEDQSQIIKEYGHLKSLYDLHARHQYPRCQFSTLSMGMSGDYKIALAQGSNMIRVGSVIFGERSKLH